MWWMIIVMIAMMIAGELLRPKPKFGTPQPSALGDFTLPTAEEGRAVPVVWGTCKISGPNVVWFGDLQINPIKKKVKTGLFSSKKIITGYKYYLGMQIVLAQGTLEFISLKWGDKSPSYTTNTSDPNHFTISINSPDLFGGEESEGGISGMMDFYPGTSAQVPNDYLQAKVGKSLPAYRPHCYAVMRGMYVGTSSYLKSPSFVVRRCPNQLGLTGNKHNINGDANPACMLYEILTDPTWSIGVSPVMIDAASFTSAGNTLFAEGMGLSMILDSPSDANGVIGDILRHVDGVIYTDPSTGLITLKLARQDYDVNTIPKMNPSNVKSCTMARSSWSETRNTIKIQYTDRSQDFTEAVAQAQDLANIQARGGEVVTESITFRGVSNGATASLVAQRALKTLSYPLASLELKVNRLAWNMRPGSVFRLDWTPLGISAMTCRVTRISYGGLTDATISIDAVEDIFGLTSTAYAPPPPSEWTDTNFTPQPLAFQRLEEAPYQLVGSADRYVMTLGTRAGVVETGYQVWTDRNSGGTNYSQSEDIPAFTPSATLVSTYPKTTSAIDNTGFVVQGGKDMFDLASATDADWNAGKNILLVDGELIAWKTVTDNGDGTYTIAGLMRAVLDTIPADHAAGARVWFLTEGVGLTDDSPYGADLTLNAKLLTYTPTKTLTLADVSAVSITTSSRAQKPYAPGLIRVNTLAWPTTTTGDATMTWAHRNRVTQATAETVLSQDAASVAAGPEGNYTVEVRVGGVLKQTFSAVTGTSQAYTAAQRLADDTDGTKVVAMRVIPVNGTLTGTYQERSFTMTGFGMQFGLNFGGVQQ
jgi:hypothetical protein